MDLYSDRPFAYLEFLGRSSDLDANSSLMN